jgi:membrane protein implicated in regulation of membrane protease activity
MDAMYIWLIAGVLFFALEAIGISGVGFLFAGFGATTVGTLVYSGMLQADNTIIQFIIFFATTAIWAILLWKPLQQFRLRKGPQGYSNMVGETAYVGSNGIDAKGGEVTWSGTIMKAQIAAGVTLTRLEAGSQVTIVDIVGTTLMVKPK